MANHNKITSFLTAKCPNCGEGKVFKHGPYHRQFIVVNTECTHCRMKFEPEPGFYFGAMYFTYAINVALMIFALVLFNMFSEEFSPLHYLITIVVIVLVFINFIVRLSRLMMLYLFGKPRA